MDTLYKSKILLCDKFPWSGLQNNIRDELVLGDEITFSKSRGDWRLSVHLLEKYGKWSFSFPSGQSLSDSLSKKMVIVDTYKTLVKMLMIKLARVKEIWQMDFSLPIG